MAQARGGLGERIASLRSARGMSQAQLGGAIGRSPQSVSTYERGAAEPDSDSLVAICAALGCSADWLLGIDGRAPARSDAPDEERLLSLWRGMSDEGRAALMASAEAMQRALPRGCPPHTRG